MTPLPPPDIWKDSQFFSVSLGASCSDFLLLLLTVPGAFLLLPREPLSTLLRPRWASLAFILAQYSSHELAAQSRLDRRVGHCCSAEQVAFRAPKPVPPGVLTPGLCVSHPPTLSLSTIGPGVPCSPVPCPFLCFPNPKTGPLPRGLLPVPSAKPPTAANLISSF